MRKLLTIHGQHHSKTDVDLLCVPRKQKRRDLTQLEAAHAVEITKLVEYVDRKEDPLIKGYQKTPTQHRLSSVTDS